MSESILGPTQPPIQWLMLTLLRGIRRQKHKPSHSPLPISELIKYGAKPPFPLHPNVLRLINSAQEKFNLITNDIQVRVKIKVKLFLFLIN
jgi:hypothetical protein